MLGDIRPRVVFAGAHEAATKTGETPSAEANDFVPFSATPLLPRLHSHAIRRCTDRVGRTKVKKFLVSMPPPATRGTDFLTQEAHPPQQSL